MKCDSEVARIIASLLLQSKAVKLDAVTPFTWASGIKSPIYCDNRLTLSFPQVRRQIALQFSRIIRENFPEAAVIAGVATGAIAHGILVAEEMGLPFVYVRNAAKGHGLGNQIEGRILKGEKTVVIEDLVSTGQSSLAAVKALREAGFLVEGMLAIFSYQFPEAEEAMAQHEIDLYTLSNYTCLLETALQESRITEEDMQILSKWRENPRAWGE
ncbi:MAG: orotate phosphoribosyltransferase [Bacteroides sp.]|jgi:orotate phosphoribosyltransferase|nr:orotate phosphoribosyltransferase [Bacteroides sp.]